MEHTVVMLMPIAPVENPGHFTARVIQASLGMESCVLVNMGLGLDFFIKVYGPFKSPIQNGSNVIDFIFIWIGSHETVSWKATDKFVALYNGSWFTGGRKPECQEKTLEVRLRSTETQPTYNICSRVGRRDWCPLRQSDFPNVMSLTEQLWNFWKAKQPSKREDTVQKVLTMIKIFFPWFAWIVHLFRHKIFSSSNSFGVIRAQQFAIFVVALCKRGYGVAIVELCNWSYRCAFLPKFSALGNFYKKMTWLLKPKKRRWCIFLCWLW